MNLLKYPSDKRLTLKISHAELFILPCWVYFGDNASNVVGYLNVNLLKYLKGTSIQR